MLFFLLLVMKIDLILQHSNTKWKTTELLSFAVDMDRVEVSFVHLPRGLVTTKTKHEIGTMLKDFLSRNQHACSYAIKIAEVLFRSGIFMRRNSHNVVWECFMLYLWWNVIFFKIHNSEFCVTFLGFYDNIFLSLRCLQSRDLCNSQRDVLFPFIYLKTSHFSITCYTFPSQSPMKLYVLKQRHKASDHISNCRKHRCKHTCGKSI